MIINNNINCFLKLINHCNDCFFLPNSFFFYKWLWKLYKFFNIKRYINIILVNKEYILFLNKKYKSRNYITDVLSFSYYLNFNNNCLGEIFLCPLFILQKSFKESINYFFYFSYLLIHSFLHILGFNHNKYYDFKIMRFIECFFLFKLKKIYFLENLLVKKNIWVI